MHSVRLGSQSRMSMIFSAPSGGGRMIFLEDNPFAWMLDIPCSFGVQTIIDFNFCLHTAAGENSGVNLTSFGAFAVMATLWMGITGIGVTERATPIPGILS